MNVANMIFLYHLSNNTQFHHDLASKQESNVICNNNRVYEVLILSVQEFIKNPNINYTKFVQFPSQALKSNIVNYFIEKCDRYHKSFQLHDEN